MNKTLKYVSLFSSAGVGCYGFKKSGFDCVATNEIIERRLDVQKINKKCSSETGYISGDITLQETKDLIMEEIRKNCGTKPCSLDLLVATPPCQGMSVANLKKTDEDINRNSLVVESVEMVKRIIPKFFVFENVPAFLNTCCIDNNNDLKTISEMITDELGKHYSIYSKTINFKNYGSMSSRTRTLVIGVHKKYSNYISPIELFPAYREEKTLREVIGDLPTLQWGEFYKNDFYHQFRTYSENMYEWIANTPEGESAFDNENPLHRPHQIIDGNMVPHVRKNSGKYTRMFWDKVAPCILTRNDQFASQRTIHPTENRVLSIRELMRLMTIPDDFKWCDYSLEELNQMTEIQKKELLKKNEINIRQSIGEAVPTEIFHQIGNNIKTFLSHKLFESKHFSKLSSIYDLENNIKEFIVHNPENYTVQSLSLILELSNANRLNTAAYYTDKSLLTEITKELPEFNKNTIRILEPSVGAGNFIPFLVNKYEDKELIIDVVDIDISILECTKELLEKYSFSDKVQINYIHTDFLLQDFDNSYDLLIGNPPFGKIGDSTLFQMYKQNVKNKETNNISSFFLEKAMDISNHVVMILPKAICNAPDFKITREIIETKELNTIIDFGEKGFKGVKLETVCLFINTKRKANKTKVISITLNITINQIQSYIMDSKFPYWILYRNSEFDSLCNKMIFNIFTAYRDRQITNSLLVKVPTGNTIPVIRSGNIADDGSTIVSIENYDTHIDIEDAKKLNVYKYFDVDNVYLTPNMTYYPRVIKKPKNVICNGSVAILTLKDGYEISPLDLAFFSTEEYRNFYKIARNHQTSTLNVDNTSVFFFGKRVN